jgi:hypothetical protein
MTMSTLDFATTARRIRTKVSVNIGSGASAEVQELHRVIQRCARQLAAQCSSSLTTIATAPPTTAGAAAALCAAAALHGAATLWVSHPRHMYIWVSHPRHMYLWVSRPAAAVPWARSLKQELDELRRSSERPTARRSVAGAPAPAAQPPPPPQQPSSQLLPALATLDSEWDALLASTATPPHEPPPPPAPAPLPTELPQLPQLPAAPAGAPVPAAATPPPAGQASAGGWPTSTGGWADASWALDTPSTSTASPLSPSISAEAANATSSQPERPLSPLPLRRALAAEPASANTSAGGAPLPTVSAHGSAITGSAFDSRGRSCADDGALPSPSSRSRRTSTSRDASTLFDEEDEEEEEEEGGSSGYGGGCVAELQERVTLLEAENSALSRHVVSGAVGASGRRVAPSRAPSVASCARRVEGSRGWGLGRTGLVSPAGAGV